MNLGTNIHRKPKLDKIFAIPIPMLELELYESSRCLNYGCVECC